MGVFRLPCFVPRSVSPDSDRRCAVLEAFSLHIPTGVQNGVGSSNEKGFVAASSVGFRSLRDYCDLLVL
jgi:hypothetical protein